jgi:hypothetical protein
MATVVGFAFLWLSVTPVGKQVFLLVVPAIPNAMLCMTTTAATVQKAAFGRKKSPPLTVKKQLIASPLSMPNGQEFILVVFKEIVVRTFPLKKVDAAGVAPTAKRNPGLGKRNSITFRCALHAAVTFGSALLPHEGCLT